MFKIRNKYWYKQCECQQIISISFSKFCFSNYICVTYILWFCVRKLPISMSEFKFDFPFYVGFPSCVENIESCSKIENFDFKLELLSELLK